MGQMVPRLCVEMGALVEGSRTSPLTFFLDCILKFKLYLLL